jgi:SAM-dependent methyltransferase
LKSFALRLLGRARLLRPVYRAYEALRSFRSSNKFSLGADGLPLPPPRLRLTVAGTADAEWFLESGRLAAESIRAALPVPMESLSSLLDFGCGCGRVVRWWRELPAAVHGSDYNVALVEWCRANLPFASFGENRLEPPLAYEHEAFDLVYALSVLTHLPVGMQRAWLEELHRVSRSWAIVTTHGDAYRDRLGDEERAQYDAGEVVVRWGEVAGTNLCTTFHPRGALEQLAVEWFEVVEFVPEGAKGNPLQDLYLLRRKT